jgi:hypothetical protein
VDEAGTGDFGQYGFHDEPIVSLRTFPTRIQWSSWRRLAEIDIYDRDCDTVRCNETGWRGCLG